MSVEKMPLPTRHRALSLGAEFIEQDLAKMRAAARREDERAKSAEGGIFPLTHCFEHDLMKVAEWASAAATLRALAEQEDDRRLTT